MNIDLTGKTALVTGSTGGIGLATAKQLAASGATVIVNGRDRGRLDEARAAVQVEAMSAVVRGVVADVGTLEGCRALVEAEPKVDVLVNNAGMFAPGDFFELPDEKWGEIIATNLMSGVRLSRLYLPGMKERGWGRVIFLSSESALNIPVDMLDYGVTKTAILGLSRGLAKLMAGTNVTVNAVLPGPTLSEGVKNVLETMKPAEESIEDAGNDYVRNTRPTSILKRTTGVEEIANLITYVASPLSSATTGAALRAEGGIVESIG